MPVDPVAAARWFVQTLGCTAFPVWGSPGGRCACGDPHDGTGKHGPDNIGKHPSTPHGFKDGTDDVERIARFLSNPGTPNYGLNPPPGVLVIDVDGPGLEQWEMLQHRYGPLPVTLTTTTANGRHYWFKWPGPGPMPTGKLFGFVVRRHDDGFVLGPGSVHPTGIQYDTLRNEAGRPYAIAELPQGWAEAALKPLLTVSGRPGPEGVQVGSRHDWLRDTARYYAGVVRDPDALFAAVWAENQKLAQPKSEAEVRRAIGDALTKFGPDPVEEDPDTGEVRRVSPSETTPALIAASGVDFPGVPQPVAFGGLIGECVEAIAEGTDASRAGILAGLLAWLGALIPARTYFGAGDQTSSPYLALVGVSAMARKGTTMTRVKDALGDVFGIDSLNRVRLSGIASGEGLIMALSNRQRDDRDPWAIGVMAEAEFAGVLAAASREGSTLDARLREAFDGEQLWHTRAASVVTVKQPYWLSALIAITPSELQDKLPKGALLNGSGNRWLYVPVERRDVRSAGHVRPDVPLGVRARLTTARAATKTGPVYLPTDASTSEHLGDYERWLYSSSVGLAADLTRRYSTIALRIALIHAAVEQAGTIKVEHAERAIALTEYARSGLSFAFGDAFAGDDWSSLLLQHLHAEGGVLSAQYISRTLIKHPLQRDKAVKELQRLRLATVRVVPTKGRPRTELVLSGVQGAPFAPFAPFSGLRAKPDVPETADSRSRKQRESSAEGARKVRERGAEGVVSAAAEWLRPCRRYEDHRSDHRQTAKGWICRACDTEEES